MRRWREGVRKEGAHLKEEKKRKTRREQTSVADKPVCLQRTKKIISGLRET